MDPLKRPSSPFQTDRKETPPLFASKGDILCEAEGRRNKEKPGSPARKRIAKVGSGALLRGKGYLPPSEKKD